MSTFYTACIRSVLTYAAPVFFYALPKYLKDELVRVEKRAMSIICSGLPYQEAIELVNIVPIADFITGLCTNAFDTIIKDPEHRLNCLIETLRNDDGVASRRGSRQKVTKSTNSVRRLSSCVTQRWILGRRLVLARTGNANHSFRRENVEFIGDEARVDLSCVYI